MLGCHVKKVLSWLLLLGALVLTILLGLGIVTTPHANAVIQQLEEAPGQMLYQSRKTIKDQYGNSWQVIVFKRIPANGKISFQLRIVGFPGVAEIDRSKPLLLTNSLGKTLTAVDVSSNIFTNANSLESNVGQYDLQPLLPQLQAEIPLKLTIPTLGNQAIHLLCPPSFVQEWLIM